MHRYCGKSWSPDDVTKIRELIASRPQANRADLSRLVCNVFDWRSPNGKIKCGFIGLFHREKLRLADEKFNFWQTATRELIAV